MSNLYNEKEFILDADYPRIATITRGKHGTITLKGTRSQIEKEITSLKSILNFKDKDVKIRTARF